MLHKSTPSWGRGSCEAAGEGALAVKRNVSLPLSEPGGSTLPGEIVNFAYNFLPAILKLLLSRRAGNSRVGPC